MAKYEPPPFKCNVSVWNQPPNIIPEMWQVAGALHVLQAKGLWPALKNAYYDSLNVPPGLVLTGDPPQQSKDKNTTQPTMLCSLSLSLSFLDFFLSNYII